jgi:hypothetical protein
MYALLVEGIVVKRLSNSRAQKGNDNFGERGTALFIPRR